MFDDNLQSNYASAEFDVCDEASQFFEIIKFSTIASNALQISSYRFIICVNSNSVLYEFFMNLIRDISRISNFKSSLNVLSDVNTYSVNAMYEKNSADEKKLRIEVSTISMVLSANFMSSSYTTYSSSQEQDAKSKKKNAKRMKKKRDLNH